MKKVFGIFMVTLGLGAADGSDALKSEKRIVSKKDVERCFTERMVLLKESDFSRRIVEKKIMEQEGWIEGFSARNRVTLSRLLGEPRAYPET